MGSVPYFWEKMVLFHPKPWWNGLVFWLISSHDYLETIMYDLMIKLRAFETLDNTWENSQCLCFECSGNHLSLT